MTHRVIKGLKWATICGTPAFAAGKRRPRGAKARGLKYERQIDDALPESWVKGQWFKFEDRNGPGYCQVDFLLVEPHAVTVLEAKLSWCPEAHTQLEQLYRPVIEKAFARRMIGVAICKIITPDCKGAVASTLQSAINASAAGHSVVLHWSAKGPLIPVPPKRPAPPLPSSPLPHTL